MNIKILREEVFQANIRLWKAELAALTWGNVSGIDRKLGVMVIKPSGVRYEELKPENLSEVSLETGKVVEGNLKPSSDTPTHLVLYRLFTSLGGVAHSHSPAATSWAQARQPIPCFGTTHADHFNGPIPVTRELKPAEIETAYEEQTGKAIVECFDELAVDPLHLPGALLPNHGPFAWGINPVKAVENAIALEEIAKMALMTLSINPQSRPAPESLTDKHFQRKHGPNAYYGQTKSTE